MRCFRWKEKTTLAWPAVSLNLEEMALDPYPSSRTPRAEESPLEPDRYGAHSIRLIGMSSLCLYRGPCVRNPIENGDTSWTGNVGEEGAIGTMRNGNWGLKDRAIIWIIQFQRLKMHDWIFFLPACGTKDAIFVWKIKFLWDVNWRVYTERL